MEYFKKGDLLYKITSNYIFEVDISNIEFDSIRISVLPKIYSIIDFKYGYEEISELFFKKHYNHAMKLAEE